MTLKKENHNKTTRILNTYQEITILKNDVKSVKRNTRTNEEIVNIRKNCKYIPD